MLDDKVKSNITKQLDAFKEWLNTSEAKEHLEHIRTTVEDFKTKFNINSIDNLDEYTLKTTISSLWSMQMWTNKEYPLNRILENGIDKIRDELKNLLYGKEPFQDRYDRFTNNIKGLGPASLTEILAFYNPKEYGIWNDRSRKVLDKLGIKGIPTNKYKINGKEYENFNKVLKDIYPLIERIFDPIYKGLDLLLVDVFLYYLSLKEEHKVTEPLKEDTTYEFDHDEIIEKIVNLGVSLGYMAEDEYTIAKGARVDAIWIINLEFLGEIKYVFEVHKSGSIDSLILNLQKAKRDPSVNKLVVVADTNNLEKIKREVNSLSDDFKKSMVYLNVKDLEHAYELYTRFVDIMKGLQFNIGT